MISVIRTSVQSLALILQKKFRFNFTQAPSILEGAMKTIFLFSLFFLSACSMYKSNGRKQFESDSAGKIQTQSQSFSLQSCTKVDALKRWFQSEFPAQSYEIVVSDTDLEILKNTNAQGTVEIIATQSANPVSNESAVTCTYLFANEDIWRTHKDKFIEDLENNMMTTN